MFRFYFITVYSVSPFTLSRLSNATEIFVKFKNVFYLIYAYVFIYMCVIYVYSVSSSSYRETEKHIAENRHIHVLIIVKKSYLLNS